MSLVLSQEIKVEKKIKKTRQRSCLDDINTVEHRYYLLRFYVKIFVQNRDLFYCGIK